MVDHLGIFKDFETVLYVVVMVHLSKSIELYSTMKFNICKFLKNHLGDFYLLWDIYLRMECII